MSHIANSYLLSQHLSDMFHGLVFMSPLAYTLCRCFVCSSLSLADHRRQAGDLISGFVKKISFGHDFEQQLSFYVEVRSSFSNLDQVLIFLVQVRYYSRGFWCHVAGI
jgi:hypothetical protein